MSEAETNDLKNRLRELESKMSSLETMKAVGIALALIFGLSSGWGLKIISDANDKVREIRQDVDSLDKYVATKRNEIESLLAGLRSESANIRNAPPNAVASKTPTGVAVSTADQATKPFIKAVENFRQRTPKQPYAWVGYKDDLLELADVLQKYLGYLRINDKPVSLSEGKQFVDELRNAVHDAQQRSKDQLPKEDPYRDVHVNKNFADFTVMLDNLQKDFELAGGGRITLDQIQSFEFAVPDWREKAIVRAH